MKASQGTKLEEEETRIKPLPQRVLKKAEEELADISEESDDDEWIEADPDEVLIADDTNVDEAGASKDTMDEDEDDIEDLFDPACCFMCDHENDSIEACMVHMHKYHGFFVPDVEYLKDPKGLLTYLGLKVPS